MAPTSRKFRRVWNSLLVFTVLALSVVSVSGSSILFDADTLTGDSLVSTGSWNSSNWSISYQISQDTSSQVWTYDYTITVPERIRNNGSETGQPLNDLRSVVIEVDSSCSSDGFLSSSTSGSSNSTLPRKFHQAAGRSMYATGSFYVPDFYTADGGTNPLPTPEPASILLLGSGLLGLALARRRYGKKRTRV